MTDPCRALCAELIEAVLSDDSHIDCMQIARRARALLAQPVAKGPTDEELYELWVQNGFENDRFARAVLARYSHQ